MRILHLIDSGGFYGAERVLVELADEQRCQGLEPSILSAGEPGESRKAIESEAELRGLTVVPWRMKAGLNLREGRRILNWAAGEGFQLAHSHGYKFNILGALCRTCGHQLPIVATLHGYTASRRLSKLWLYELVDRMALWRLDALVLVSGAMQANAGVRGLPVKSRYIIPNGLPEQPPAVSALPEPIVGFRQRFRHCWVSVGRLSTEKGHETLIEAMAEVVRTYPECGLVIVGDGTQSSILAAQADYYGVADNVLFAGYQPTAEAFLPNFDALIMPSYSEGLPITVLEAMRGRVPVIATRVGGMPGALAGNDWVDQDQLVPPGDSVHLAAALRKLVMCPAWGQELAERGHKRFREDYAAPVMATEYARCYREILLARSAPS